MFTVSFPAKKLAAVFLFSAVKDIRYYLNSVFIEALQGETRIVATDGHAAALSREMADNEHLFNVMVPCATVELILKTKAPVITIAKDGDKWSINGLPFQPVDGKFPDYRRFVPTTTTGFPSNFQPEYLMRAAKAGKALKLKNAIPIMHHNGDGASVMRFNEDSSFIAVIMPMWILGKNEIDNGMPTWGAY